MNKIFWIFTIVMAALAIWGTDKAFSETTTIFAPDGTVTVCQVSSNGTVVCV